MVLQEQIAITKYVQMLPFQAVNVPDDAGDAYTVEATSLDYVMPWKGSIVGISVRHNADLTGGVITWRATIDGTGDDTLTVVTDDTHQQAYGSQAGRAVPFAAGARIGVDWTKTGTVAPTTSDVAITLFVLLEGIDL